MLIVLVYARVKPERIARFQGRYRGERAQQRVKEPGIARFDVLQSGDDPTRFVLVEAYRDVDAPARHKETAHYAAWRVAVEDMMAEPRPEREVLGRVPRRRRVGHAMTFEFATAGRVISARGARGRRLQLRHRSGSGPSW